MIVTSIEDCIKPIEEYFKSGFTRVYMHSTSPDEVKFIRDFVLRYYHILMIARVHRRSIPFSMSFLIGERSMVQYYRLHHEKKGLTAV